DEALAALGERARELMMALTMEMEWSSPNAVLGPNMGNVGMCRCVSAMEMYAGLLERQRVQLGQHCRVDGAEHVSVSVVRHGSGRRASAGAGRARAARGPSQAP